MLKNADDRGVLFGTALSAIQAGFDTAMVFPFFNNQLFRKKYLKF